VHEKLVRLVEFDIMHGTYNIKTVVKFELRHATVANIGYLVLHWHCFNFRCDNKVTDENMTRQNLMGVEERRFEADFKRCPLVRLDTEEIYEQRHYFYTMVTAQHNTVKHDLSCKGKGKAHCMKSIKANWGVQVRLHSLLSLASSPGCFYVIKGPRYPQNRRLG